MTTPPPTPTATIDYLDEDPYPPGGQRLALVSFVGPELRQKNDQMGMKIRGCFSTKEEAEAHVRRLRKVDEITDIYVVELGKWLLIPPNPMDVEDAVYSEHKLNELMKGYRESQAQSKEAFEARKAAILESGLDANLLPEERLPAPPGQNEQSPA